MILFIIQISDQSKIGGVIRILESSPSVISLDFDLDWQRKNSGTYSTSNFNWKYKQRLCWIGYLCI